MYETVLRVLLWNLGSIVLGILACHAGDRGAGFLTGVPICCETVRRVVRVSQAQKKDK